MSGMGRKKPELLAPAGDLEKLMVAVAFGADAVYVGGRRFGLRAQAKNFGAEQLREGVRYAHERGRKVYVAANIFAHEADFDGMAEFFTDAERAGADALIVSDPGVFALARETVPDMDIHVSTQAGNTNARTALFWQRLGAKRAVLARELSFLEMKDIANRMPKGFETEAFIHGAMCVSYSGRCLLSAYMAGRDANRGECAHPCRWKYGLRYALEEEKRPGEYMPVYEDERGAYILNSKDLCLIGHIPALVDAGVASFKIEGRVKSSYYVAAVVDAYRRALDDYFHDPARYESRRGEYVRALRKTSHRPFTTGFCTGGPDKDMQNGATSAYERTWDFVGIVLGYDEATKTATVSQRNKFCAGDRLEILRAVGPPLAHTVSDMTDGEGMPITAAPHAEQIVKIRVEQPVGKFDMLRREAIQ